MTAAGRLTASDTLTGRALLRLRRYGRKSLLSAGPAPERGQLFPLEAEAPPLGGWTFHDENWTRVIGRHEHRRLLQAGGILEIEDNVQSPPQEVTCGADGSVAADLAAEGRDRWVWLHLDPARHDWRNFRWTFNARRGSEFRELQFAFRYRDFYNRYRFRHQHDCLHFDIVANGHFQNSLYMAPFRMQLGRTYAYRIEVRNWRFILSVDGKVLLDEIDPEHLFPSGSIAVIFWEPNRRTPIQAAVSDVRVSEI